MPYITMLLLLAAAARGYQPHYGTLYRALREAALRRSDFTSEYGRAVQWLLDIQSSCPEVTSDLMDNVHLVASELEKDLFEVSTKEARQ